ncbi:hypothetical protein LCGC14_0734340 [marine sediment metagenome]|uniref:Uncharacterized protein n=1 Tax=marine sediment metagenome TaxID=412755 RepID=A0A0F9Q8P9_9ZZZZ
MKAPSLPWTHYVDEKRQDRMVHAFTVGKCETCHGEIEEPNAVGLEGRAALEHGLTKLPRRLPEIGHNEETEISDCENCRGRDLCEHGHEIDSGHPCIDCATALGDAMADQLRDGDL